MKYKNTKVLILGLGLNEGGVGSAKFFARQGAEVLVTDLKTETELKSSLDQLKDFPNITYHLGGHKTQDIDWADLVIRNQAVKPNNEFLKYAKKQGKEIETDIGVFLDYVNPEQIIGVTGTKGKSTTVSLIYEVLKKSAGVNSIHPKGVNSKVILVGNIGKSVLDSILQISPETLVVMEISSFQLESFDSKNISPKYAVITNIYPDHLNYYSSMEEYIVAKKLIAKYQTINDFLFINKADKTLNSPEFLNGVKTQIIFYSADDLPKDFKPQIKGEHNLENIAAALVVLKKLGVEEKQVLNIAEKFKGIEFRLQPIKEWAGFEIYNDTAATMPDASIQALKALGNEPPKDPNIILICGGMNKNMNYEEFAEAISWYAKAVYFIEGDVVDDIICNMPDQTITEGRFINLKDLLLSLKKNIETNPYFKKGDIILFSPGATSFNLFQNEFDRGRKFNAAVEKVFK